MQAIEYPKLLKPERLASLAPDAEIVEGAYALDDGLQLAQQVADRRLTWDFVRLSDEAYLLVGEHRPSGEVASRQAINDSDWIHIQFRLSGAGHEVCKSEVIETPQQSCIIARYPNHSIIERCTFQTDISRIACLFMSPEGLLNLLDISYASMPEAARWLASSEDAELRVSRLTLAPAMTLVVNDIMACNFRGANRRAYMRAKSIELLSTVVHGLSERPSNSDVVKLSRADCQRIASAHALMLDDLECTLTLAELARRVGINRTKLAVGFKKLYGSSVQSFWRDARLCYARDLLQRGDARITDVALSLGYSELSSFTRAFGRKFGVLPRNCRPKSSG